MPEAPVNVAHALCVYAEPLAARRRVVVVGDSSLGLDARLVALGARAVHVYDPDAARARAQSLNAARGVIVRELPPGEFDVREGAFDLAIVPDLGAIEDRAGLLVRLRRLVGPDGSAIVAARTIPEGAHAGGAAAGAGLDYYEMYDLVALQFASVRMIGQIHFSGVALAELGETDDEPQVSVDTQLIAENEAPELYIALAAQHDVRLEPYAIVQLPREAGVVSPQAHSIHPSQHADLAAAILRADLAQSQLEEQRTLVTRLTVEAEREERAGRATELEAALQERTAKLKEAETRAGDHYVRAERLTHETRRLEEELQRQRDRAARLTKELDEEKKSRTRAEVDLGMIRKNPDLAQARERTSLLEEGLRAAEEAVGVLQQRAIDSEQATQRRDQAIAHRDAQIAVLERELELAQVATLAAATAAAALPRIDPERVAQLAARAEGSEARAALLDAQLAAMAEAEGRELAELERMLRERAQAIGALEQELVRRERMVRELLGALEEAHAAAGAGTATGMDAPLGDSTTDATAAAAVAAASGVIDDLRGQLDRGREENGVLRSKLDALALDVARREGELQARTWRISELEERVASLEARPAPAAERPTPAVAKDEKALRPGGPSAELLALRQALTQEHSARVAAESGEDLSRARADLARQAVLLEQLATELARERASRDEERAEEPGQATGPAQT